jgi:serine protease
MELRNRLAPLALYIALAVPLASTAWGQPQPTGKLAAAASQSRDRPIVQLIVKYRNENVRTFSATAGRSKLATLAARSNVGLAYLRPMSGLSHVVKLAEPMPRAEAFALAKRLEMDPSVEYAEVDDWVYPAFVPNDPLYATHQWHFQAPSAATGNAGGVDAPAAWDIARGQGVIVAVVDTGVAVHPDLSANVLPGYDFIIEPWRANDGDGRDTDATDPGDWVTADYCGTGEPAKDSSWHGTHVAGTIAEVTDNGLLMAGLAHQARILPVRVLGRCGGLTSDVADGIRWAAGLSVPGVPANPNRAKVINLSLGSNQPCPATHATAVADARAAGAVVVASTGNKSLEAIGSPANCPGVIAVTAHTYQGDRADYANVGPGTAISAPGGGSCFTPDGGGFVCSTRSASVINHGVWSTSLYGPTTPTSTDSQGRSGATYLWKRGTSMATPHVAATAALLLSRMPTLVPDEVRFLLTSSARPHPAGLYCAVLGTDGRCGSGLLDARAALARLDDRTPAVTVNAPQVVAGGQVATLQATATARNGGSGSFTYAWTQTGGPPVTLSNAGAASASFVGTNPGGTHTFRVTVTDGNGYVVTQTASVRSNNPPATQPVPAQTVVQGGSLSFTVRATDPENDTVTYVASNLPAGSTFAAATGQFSWPSVGAAPGLYSFTVMANDGTVNSVPVTVNITVTSPPPPPGGGGGGGALGPLSAAALILLYALAAAQRRRAAQRNRMQS